MKTTLTSELSRERRAHARLAELEAERPSHTPLSKKFRYLAILHTLDYPRDTAWGRRMNGRGLVQRRWKPWNKARMDMTTFPFKLKPECKDK